MTIDRWEFILTLGSAVLLTATRSGLSDEPATATTPAAGESVVDAGQLNEFSKDGVYDGHRDEGFFVIRRDDHLFALSSICTHKGCKVRAQEDGSYMCKCHGSTYDRDGKVTKGPAPKDLPRLAVATDATMRSKVDLNQKFEAGHFSDPAEKNKQ